MPQSIANLLAHLIFSTRDRRPALSDPVVRRDLYAYMGGIIQGNRGEPLQIGGVADHVHILMVCPLTILMPDVIGDLKRASNLWLKTRAPGFENFYWQSGYGLFSVGQTEVEVARQYILDQETHHKKVTFQDEFRRMLRTYKKEYNEKFVWD